MSLGLRTRVMILIAAAMVPAAAVGLLNASREARHSLHMASEQVVALARQLASDNGQMVGGTRDLLEAVATFPSIESGNLEHCRRVLTRMQGKLRQYAAFAVANPAGLVICSSQPLSDPVSVADHPWFPRALAGDGLTVGDVRPEGIAGTPAIHFARAIRDPGGKPVAVAFAAYDIAHLRSTLTHAELPAAGHLSLVDSTGRIAFRSPDPENSVGKLLPDGGILRPMREEGEGVTEGMGVDGKRQIFGFSPLGGTSDTGLFAVISVERDELIASALATFWLSMAVVAGVGFLVGLVGWFGSGLLLRDIRRLAGTAERLAEGDLAARVAFDGGSREIGELSHTFNGMANALETRTRQTETALARLKRANADLDRFTQVAAHDLREPIRQMVTYAQRLERKLGDRLDGDSREEMGFIAESARRLHAVFHDLLDYAQTRPPEVAVPVDAQQILMTVVPDFLPAVAERGGTLDSEPLPSVMADPHGLEVVFREVLDNAVKFHSPQRPPQIRITTETLAGYAMTTVADNGIGFDAEYEERIFNPFVRLHPMGLYPGTGIGLAKCRRIVEGWGGAIAASAMADGGCEITLALPTIPTENT
ncbi:MAG: ATP-binding protein [Magnetospirillum sp. WYHS-4]